MSRQPLVQGFRRTKPASEGCLRTKMIDYTFYSLLDRLFHVLSSPITVNAA